MSLCSVAVGGLVVSLREDYSDYMPQLAVDVDALLRTDVRDSVARLVERLRERSDDYLAITEEAVRQRLVRLFSSGSEGVVVDGRGYVLGRRERGRRVLEVRRDDAAAAVRGSPVSALGRSVAVRDPAPALPRRRDDVLTESESEVLTELRALLVRPAAGGLPAYTAVQLLGQIQADLFELRKAVDALQKEDAP